MNLLLDTHVALWAIADSPKLPQKARNLIQSARTTVWISSASVWEIAIKHALGRGDMPISSRDAVRYFRDSGYRFLVVVRCFPQIGVEVLCLEVVSSAYVETYFIYSSFNPLVKECLDVPAFIYPETVVLYVGVWNLSIVDITQYVRLFKHKVAQSSN